MKKYKFLPTFVLFFLLLAAILIVFFVQSMPVSPQNASPICRIEIQKGETAQSAAYKLKALDIIKSPRLFYAAARFPSVHFLLTRKAGAFTLKSGYYKLSGSMTLSKVLDILSSGKEEYIRVALPEGLTISKIAARLEKERILLRRQRIPHCLQTTKFLQKVLKATFFPIRIFLPPRQEEMKRLRRWRIIFLVILKRRANSLICRLKH